MRTSDQNQGAPWNEGTIPVAAASLARARRQVLKGALGLGFALPLVGTGSAQEAEPRSLRPKAGDRLVFAAGDRKGAVIAPADLPLGGPQVLAYPQDAKSSVIRDGSRLNQVALVRLDPKELSEGTLADAADGVIAYSAVCTHQGCPISMWQDKAQTLFCSCHGFGVRSAQRRRSGGRAGAPAACRPPTQGGGRRSDRGRRVLGARRFQTITVRRERAFPAMTRQPTDRGRRQR